MIEYSREEFHAICGVCLDYDDFERISHLGQMQSTRSFVFPPKEYAILGICRGENGIEGLHIRGSLIKGFDFLNKDFVITDRSTTIFEFI